MPGTTTYLDTPVVPIAAFAGPDQFPVDVEFESGTPVDQRRWTADGGVGPTSTATGQRDHDLLPGHAVQVPNPDYDGTSATAPTVTRDYGFGADRGTAIVTIDGEALTSQAGAPT